MKTSTLPIVLLLLALRAHAADSAADAALAVVADLGRVNGQALACEDKEAAARAKALMLRHAPRSPRYGEAFEQATQQGFLAQVKTQNPYCPDAQALAEKVEVVARRLREILPEVDAR